MKNLDVAYTLDETVRLLSNASSTGYEYIPQHGKSLPSTTKLIEIVDLLRAIIFSGYFGTSILKPTTLPYFISGNLERLYELLTEQIHNGFCFNVPEFDCNSTIGLSSDIALTFIKKIPEIRRILATDVRATFDGDPAATNAGEIIFSYPSIRAMLNHRVAHELLQLEVPMLPRMISELAHSETGIDINPGAKIGEAFCIDHGTGVVIGETCIIGNNVRLYQGVTLGAKRFVLDENGNPIKSLPRHPILEDGVVVYANATILGRITIGKNSSIGGNVWVTNDVAPNSKVLQQKPVSNTFTDGLGI